jgi:predicted permease
MIDLFEFSGVSWTSDNDPAPTRLEQRGSRWLFVKGRLAEGRTVEQARSQVNAIFASLRSEFPVTHKNVQASVVSAASIRFHPAIDGYIRVGSVVLLTAVGLVLLIACVNVANMLLARSTAREREVAIRAALGAGRGRIIGQLLGEGVVLAAIGGTLGILIANWGSQAFSVFGTEAFPVPVDFDVSVDGTVLVFAIVVSLLTSVLFGLAPALSASRVDLVSALKASSAVEGSGGKRRIPLRDVLVAGQMAFCVVLLVAGSLLTRALLTARATDIGYDPTPLSFLSFNLRMIGYDQPRATALKDRALETIAALPGVVAVSYATRLPLAPDITMDGIKIPGRHSASDQSTPVDRVAVGPNYFRTVGVPIVSGREFTTEEIREGLRVAVINETMARRYWPDGSAIGRRFHLGEFADPPHEIVGVARDHAVRSVGEEPRPYLHLPTDEGGLLVRTTTPAVSALPMLRETLWKLEPNIVFKDDVSAAEVAAETTGPTRIGAGLLGTFGALALLLAGVGLYGVIAYSVSLRTREVGIRMAVGADRGRIVRMVLGQGARLAAAGVLVGTLAAAATTRVLASLLYGISPWDPAAYAIAAGLLLAVACLANLVPALSAARIDPLRALKAE